MGRLGALIGCVVAGFLLFYAGSRTPDPKPASAPAGQFAAGRALADIAVMARVPHPIGSAANQRVRDYLIGRMTALGLAPRVQRGEGDMRRTFGKTTLISGGDVENVIGVLPGRDRRLPALTLMAHYDSVPGSPGAADDVTGVAAILEIVRVIKAAGTPARDVMVLFTDGEERGLLGATAFFRDDPAADGVGFLMNLEARGGGGRATMFETGDNNGGAVELYRRTAVRPSANSLTVFVYKHLPNDTDFTVAKARGIAGLNYAFIGRQFDYHSPSSTAAALDPGSVQHIGDEVLGTARALAFSATLPARTPDKVYGPIAGDLLLAYPAWGGWVLLAAIAGLIGVAVRRGGPGALGSWRDVAGGIVAGPLLLAGAAAALYLTRQATGYGFGWMEGRPLLARFATYEAAMALTGLGALMLIAAVLGRWVRFLGGWIGLLATGLVAALALQLWAPTIAMTIAWPLAAGAACAALIGPDPDRRRLGWGAALLVIALTLAWLGTLFHFLLQGLDVPTLPALIVWLAAFCLWPLVWTARERGLGVALAPAGVLLASGLAIALGLNVTGPYSPRHPRAASLLYVVDQTDGRAWRVSARAPAPWTRAVLSADGGAIVRRSLPWFDDQVWAAPANSVAAPAPEISVARNPDGTVSLRGQAPADVELGLQVSLDTAISGVTLNGRPMPYAAPPGSPIRISWAAAPEGFVLTFRPAGPGTITGSYAAYRPGWPAAAQPLPPLPPKLMGWDMFGSTVAVGRVNGRW